MKLHWLESFYRARSALAARSSMARTLATAGAIHVAAHPVLVEAGILSASICREWRKYADSELFIVLTVVAAVALIITWKLGGMTGPLAKGIALMVSLLLLLSIENIVMGLAGKTGGMC